MSTVTLSTSAVHYSNKTQKTKMALVARYLALTPEDFVAIVICFEILFKVKPEESSLSKT